jgi:hypothetical protein
MPSKEPLPSFGTAAQAAPKGSAIVLALIEGVMAGVVIGALALMDGAEDDAGAAGVIAPLQAVSASGRERAAARPASLALRFLENMLGSSFPSGG